MAKRITEKEIEDVWEVWSKGYRSKDISIYLDMKLNRVEYIIKQLKNMEA